MYVARFDIRLRPIMLFKFPIMSLHYSQLGFLCSIISLCYYHQSLKKYISMNFNIICQFVYLPDRSIRV